MSMPSPSRSRLPAVAALVVLTAAGCRGDVSPTSAETARIASEEGDVAADLETGTVSLVGSTWVAVGFLDGEVIDPPSAPGRLRFEPNGFVTGFDGCNGFGYATSGAGDDVVVEGLRYALIDSTIEFSGPLVSTLIGCPDTTYETRVRHVLGDTVTYDIDGDILTLAASDGSGVVFKAGP